MIEQNPNVLGSAQGFSKCPNLDSFDKLADPIVECLAEPLDTVHVTLDLDRVVSDPDNHAPPPIFAQVSPVK
jgi:hypothetical protein